MPQVFRTLAVAAAIGCIGTASHANVLTFEELPAGLFFFTSNYQSFKFGTNRASDNAWFFTSLSDADYQPSSGRTFVATDFQLYKGGLWDDTQPITSTIDFRFDGAWFTGNNQVRYKLFNDGQLVHTSADSEVLNPTPQWVASGYAGFIDSVVVVGRQGFYAMDDFTATPVPEASSVAMFAAGLLTLGALMRRRAGRAVA
jgi:hypothetical protein